MSLVLNTNGNNGNGSFQFNNSFMNGFTPDISNSVILTGGNNKELSPKKNIDGIQGYYDMPILVPYAFAGKEGGGGFFGPLRYYGKTTNRFRPGGTGTFPDSDLGAEYIITSPIISRGTLQGGEVVGKRLFANIPGGAMLFCAISKYNQSGSMVLTNGYVSVESFIRVGLLQNGVKYKIGDIILGKHRQQFAQSSPVNDYSVGMRSNDIEDGIYSGSENAGLIAQAGDRIYFEVGLRSTFEGNSLTVGNVSDALFYSSGFYGDFGTQGLTSYTLGTNTNETYQYYNNSTSSANITIGTYQGKTAPLGFIQTSID